MISYLLSLYRAEWLRTAYKARIGWGTLTGMNTVGGICRDEDAYTFPRILFAEMYRAALSARGNRGALVGKEPFTYLGGEDERGQIRPVPAGAPPAPTGLPARAIMKVRDTYRHVMDYCDRFMDYANVRYPNAERDAPLKYGLHRDLNSGFPLKYELCPAA